MTPTIPWKLRVKGPVHEIEFKQKWIIMGLNKSLYSLQVWTLKLSPDLLDFAAKFLGDPPSFPLVHWINCWFLLVHCFSSIIIFWYKKAYLRVAKKFRWFCAALEYVLPVHRNLLECRWGHLKTLLANVIDDFEEVSRIYFFSKMFYTLTNWTIANAIVHQRNI